MALKRSGVVPGLVLAVVAVAITSGYGFYRWRIDDIAGQIAEQISNRSATDPVALQSGADTPEAQIGPAPIEDPPAAHR